MSNERECCAQYEAAKVPRLAAAGALLCHVLIFVLLHLQSVTAEAQPGHHADDTQGRGGGAMQKLRN